MKYWGPQIYNRSLITLTSITVIISNIHSGIFVFQDYFRANVILINDYHDFHPLSLFETGLVIFGGKFGSKVNEVTFNVKLAIPLIS